MSEKYLHEMIDDIEVLIDEAKPARFSPGKITIEKDVLMTVIEELRKQIPGEIERSHKIILNKDAILEAVYFGYADKAENWELVAQYQFDFGLRPSLAYVTSRGTDVQGWGKQNLKKYIDVGATYYFNKNMSTYVDYQINLLDDNEFTDQAGINTDDVVALGLVYQF